MSDKNDFLRKARIILQKALVQIKINLSLETQEKLLFFLQELRKFSEPLGLTSLKTPQEMVIKHIIDSLFLLPFLSSKGRGLDIGTGPGLPGMVLKIVQPEMEMWLVDARRKPISFLFYIKGHLKLSGIKIVRDRIGKDSVLPQKYFSFAFSRAVTSLENLCKLAFPFLQNQGFLLAMKGPKVMKELPLNITDPHRLEMHKYVLPLLEEERIIIKITKLS